MNKKSELTGPCSCNARFLRLYLKGVGGADETSCGSRKLACGVCTTGLESSTKKKKNEVDPKKYPENRYIRVPGFRTFTFLVLEKTVGLFSGIIV